MMSLDEIREGLKDRNIQAVSRATGLHRQTIYNVVNGKGNTLYVTAATLSDYLKGKNQ